MLRRLLSIMLFAATVLPVVAPMLLAGATTELQLPACCRRDGKHHCAMNLAQLQAASSKTMARAPRMQCPFEQRSTATPHLDTYAATSAAIKLTGLVREPSAAARAECLRRISFDRSRQKRGPPTLLS